MLQFPSSTKQNKRVSKESFYKHIKISSEIKQSFVDNIDRIVLSNTLSPDTLQIQENLSVRSIEVLTVDLKRYNYNYKIFEVIEKSFPRHLLFVLRYSNEIQLLIHYKEQYENVKGKFRVINYYKTEWEREENVKLTISGFDLELIYHNFVYQIAGDKLYKDSEISLSQAVDRNLEIEKIEKKITRLEAKMRKEKQFNIQLEVFNKIKELKQKIQE